MGDVAQMVKAQLVCWRLWLLCPAPQHVKTNITTTTLDIVQKACIPAYEVFKVIIS